MADIKYLHSEAAKLRRKMQEEFDNADRATMKVTSYSKAGMFDNASAESENANRHYKEAMRLNHMATDLDNEAADLEVKANELEKQKADLENSTREKINIIERMKRALRGN